MSKRRSKRRKAGENDVDEIEIETAEDGADDAVEQIEESAASKPPPEPSYPALDDKKPANRQQHDGLVGVRKLGGRGRSCYIRGKATRQRYWYDADTGVVRMAPLDAQSIVDGVNWDYGI